MKRENSSIITELLCFCNGLEGAHEWDFDILTTQNQENQVKLEVPGNLY